MLMCDCWDNSGERLDDGPVVYVDSVSSCGLGVRALVGEDKVLPSTAAVDTLPTNVPGIRLEDGDWLDY